MLKACPFRRVDPTFQKREVKLISPGFICNIQKLCRWALIPDSRIQRDTPKRREDDIVAMLNHIHEVFLKKFPMLFTPAWNIVICLNAVCIEPVD